MHMDKSPYQKVASYEVKDEKVDNILLLYSGGLDTSVMLKWLQDQYGAKVTTLTLDLGQQHDDLESIKAKALQLGAVEAIVLDAKDEFAEEYLAKGIKANAHYQGEYHLSTAMARAVSAKKGVEVAQKKGVKCIAHGCTGKGNDQVRFDGYILALDSTMKIIAPVREWNMDRNAEIEYAKEHGIPVPVKKDFPYSDDDNMGGITWEGGEITDPSLVAPEERFLTTYTLPKDAPDKEEVIKLTFENGISVALNRKKMKLAPLIMALNKIAGAHGVGTSQVLEDRLVGLKNRGIYEHPGLHTIIEAHRYLERYVSTRVLNETKEILDTRWGYLCYAALWFDPVMDAINAFNDSVNEKVLGEVSIRLFKGQATVVAMESPYALSFASFNNAEGYEYNVNASAGFIEVHTLQMKIANEVARKNMKKKSSGGGSAAGGNK